MCVCGRELYPTCARGQAANAMEEPYPSIDIMKLKFIYLFQRRAH